MKKLITALIIVLCFMVIDLNGYDAGYLEHFKYKVPYSHGDNNLDAMKGLGFIMALHCPVEMHELYAKAWGFDAKYHEGVPPFDPSNPFVEMDDPTWNDYTVALLRIRERARAGWTAMLPYERLLLQRFCEGIAEAKTKIQNEDPDWFAEIDAYSEDFSVIRPVHVIALYLYKYIQTPFNLRVYGLFDDFGPSEGDNYIFDNDEYIPTGSQMWTFIEDTSSKIPWMQIDTHMGYTEPSQYRPFLCEVRSRDQLRRPINYFGWNLIGLPFMGPGVRYKSGNLPAITFGFTSHYQDTVDVYELEYRQTTPETPEYLWDVQNNIWKPLTSRNDIIVEYEGGEEYRFTGVYETDDHGPVITIEENLGTEYLYAARGCWDVEDSMYNPIKQWYGTITAESIEEILQIMGECKCLPVGSYIFANGDPGIDNARIQFLLGGPIPDRTDCHSHQAYLEDWKGWVKKGLKGHLYPDGTTDIFQTVHDYNSDIFKLPQDNDLNPAVDIDYFINCNCSINQNNPNSDVLAFEYSDTRPAYMICEDVETYRQLRAADIYENDQGFSLDKEYLIDKMVFDRCSGWGKELVPDIDLVFNEYIDDLLYDPRIDQAMGILNAWCNAATPDLFDDAMATTDSTGMFLFKLWQCHFIDWLVNTPNEYPHWSKYFDLPSKRIHLWSHHPDDEDFCRQVLIELGDAYDDWKYWEEDPDRSNEWGDHFFIARRYGIEDYDYIRTDGDNKTLRQNGYRFVHWWQNLLNRDNGKTFVGSGGSTPILAKLDPSNPAGVTLWYSRTVDSCTDFDATKLIFDGTNVFDVTFPSTYNWALATYNDFLEYVPPAEP